MTASSHGEISVSGRGNWSVLKTSKAHSSCIQLVPHLAGGLITMSSWRNGNLVHSALSDIIIWYRRMPPMYVDCMSTNDVRLPDRSGHSRALHSARMTTWRDSGLKVVR